MTTRIEDSNESLNPVVDGAKEHSIGTPREQAYTHTPTEAPNKVESTPLKHKNG